VSRVVVVQYKPGESDALTNRLRRDGVDAESYQQRGSKGFRALREAPPDAIVIDLTSMPFYGRWMGAQLRESKALRTIPLVFVEGDPEKMAVAKRQFPDAVFTAWDKVAAGVRKAIARPPADPVAPDIWAGPLHKKLRIREGSTVAMIGAPKDLDLGPMPEGVKVQRRVGETDLTIAFFTNAATLSRALSSLAAAIIAGRTLWICWPKRTSGKGSDLTMPRIREMCQPYRLTDTKVVALNETWSAMGFSRRRH
jgi:hypothetical protein